ncbi:rna methylase hua enhancer 1 [Moniliophthora roreri]|nr:rna methylase hua enhancer 1 [Moniliophthora roreri]
MPPPRAHDAHPVSPPLSGFIAELGIDAEHNKRWIKLFPRAVRRLERIWWNVHVLSGLEGRPKTGTYMVNFYDVMDTHSCSRSENPPSF